jgi:hypothetical protein
VTATITPMTMTAKMKMKDADAFRVQLQTGRASESNAPPMVAFPVKEEKEAPHNPTIKNESLYFYHKLKDMSLTCLLIDLMQ